MAAAKEKMFSLTHLISETKLLGLIATHADEVHVNIFQPEPVKYQRRLRNGEATASPLMLEGPKPAKPPKDAATPKTPKGLKQTASSATLDYLAKHSNRACTNAEIEKHITALGLSKGSISVSIAGFVKGGLVERTAPGQYKILKDGLAKVEARKEAAKAATKAAKPAKSPKVPKTKEPGVGRGNYTRDSSKGAGTGLIWAALCEGSPVASKDMVPTYKAAGLAPQSLSNAFSSFIKKGLATRVSEGVFQITAQGIAKRDTPPQSSTT